jgi:hypothetical protein
MFVPMTWNDRVALVSSTDRRNTYLKQRSWSDEHEVSSYRIYGSAKC